LVHKGFADPQIFLFGSDGEVLEWHYVRVRRYFVYLEHSLYEALARAVFEPNTADA
jgi:phage tail sheath protein FI